MLAHDLGELAAWMANVLEIINSVRQALRNLGISGGTMTSSSRAKADDDSGLSEVATTLQEIAVYAFQQILYPVTKVCCLSVCSDCALLQALLEITIDNGVQVHRITVYSVAFVL